MPEVTYEVMVYSPVTAGHLRRETWYVESAHASHAEGWRHFRRFIELHPDERLVVALIQSSYDETTRRFRDRVIEARDSSLPSFARSSRRLTPEARSALHQLYGEPATQEAAETAGRWRTRPAQRKAGAGPRPLVWAATAAVTACLLGAATLFLLPR